MLDKIFSGPKFLLQFINFISELKNKLQNAKIYDMKIIEQTDLQHLIRSSMHQESYEIEMVLICAFIYG